MQTMTSPLIATDRPDAGRPNAGRPNSDSPAARAISTALGAGEQPALEQIWALLEAVPDPEVPVVNVVELGIVRALAWQQQTLEVTLTPTYSGCPATHFIEEEIAAALHGAGIQDVRLRQQLAPAWTTDWLTDSARDKLRQYGIAPPVGSASKRTLLGEDPVVACPQCGSTHTEQVSEFGSTACKALYRCTECLEPFDYFKCI